MHVCRVNGNLSVKGFAQLMENSSRASYQEDGLLVSIPSRKLKIPSRSVWILNLNIIIKPSCPR